MKDLEWLTAAEISAAYAARKLSPVELVQGADCPDRSRQPAGRRIHQRRRGGRARRRAPGREGHRERTRARSVARRAVRPEGQHRRRRAADDLPLQDPARQRGARGCRRRREPARRPARSCWASSRCMNSHSAGRRRNCRSRTRGIPGTPTTILADRRRARASRSPPAWCRCRSAPTRAVRSAIRPATAASSGSSRPTA